MTIWPRSAKIASLNIIVYPRSSSHLKVAVMSSRRNLFVGLAATALTLLCIELFGRFAVKVPYPPVIYLCAVVFAAYVGGMVTGLASAVVSLVYVAMLLSDQG